MTEKNWHAEALSHITESDWFDFVYEALLSSYGFQSKVVCSESEGETDKSYEAVDQVAFDFANTLRKAFCKE